MCSFENERISLIKKVNKEIFMNNFGVIQCFFGWIEYSDPASSIVFLVVVTYMSNSSFYAVNSGLA